MAQTTRNLLATNYAFADYQYPSTVFDITNYDGGGISHKNMPSLNRTSSGTIRQRAYYQFEDWPSADKNKRIYTIECRLGYDCFDLDGTMRGVPLMEPLQGKINPATLTWTNCPLPYSSQLYLIGPFIEGSYSTPYSEATLSISGKNTITDTERSQLAALFLQYSAAHVIEGWTGGDYTRTLWTSKYLSDNTSKPYLKVTYDNSVNVASKITAKSGPMSGYVNPRNATSFSWAFERDPSETYYCAGGFTQASAVFHWKATGGEWNTINASGTSLTVPANTFPTGTSIEWYLTGVDNCGTSSESTHYTISTSAASAVCTNISPVNTVEDGRDAITFKWNIATADGAAATRVELWWKLPTEASNQWHEIVDINEPITQYTVPAGYFNAGETQWLVHAYNIDGTKGPDAKTSFIVLNAPLTPVVYTDNAPFTTMTWQVEGQQSYEVEIDGKKYGPYFGTEKTFTSPDFLEDGEHHARVRVMGVYGLWSDWGEATITVENEDPDRFDMTCLANVDAEMSWTVQTVEDYFIYRDGVQIAHTHETSFIDRAALGTHDYFVISKHTNGHYSKSITLTRTESVDRLYIALLLGEDWVRIEHKLKGDTPNYSDSRTVFYNQVSGHKFPIVEISEFEDRTVEYSAVFFYNEEEERKRFVSMFGKPVILKTPDNEVVVGVLESWQKHAKKWAYTAYSFTIRKIDWGDYIDLSGD